MNAEVLGIDIGGVIIDRVNDGTDTSFFSDNYLRTTAVPGVFDALRQLVEKRFGDKVFLVSKCGQRVQDKTLQWLAHHRFYELTGIGRERVRFCRERHEKAGICEELGITHFVDDRLEVLGNLTAVGKLYLFQPRPEEVRRFSNFLPRVRQVNSWQEIVDELLPFGEARECWCPCNCGCTEPDLTPFGLCPDCENGNHEVPPAGVSPGVEELLALHESIAAQYKAVLQERSKEAGRSGA